MLKLINSVLLLVILCGGLHLIQGEKLNCEFRDEDYHVGTLHSCVVTSLDNSFNNITIEGYTGTHLANTNESDIKAIWIDNTSTKYIPADLGLLFKLTALLLARSQLVEIKSNDFRGMQNLEHLNLYGNKLTSVPSDVFSKLTKLKFISLDSNQIKYIGIGVFDKLTNLNEVYLDGNICVYEKYSNSTEIITLKKDVIDNCVNQIDVIQKEIEIKINDESTKAIEKNEKLNCKFRDKGYHVVGILYYCAVKSLENSFNNMTIDGYTGTHNGNKTDNDVKAIWIDRANTMYIPANLGLLFNLTMFSIHSSNLVEIKVENFIGMENLESLTLYDNKLTSLPSDVFRMLTKLKFISLSRNKLEEIPKYLLINNLNLEEIHFQKNQIKYINSELFNELTKLNYVQLEGNSCGNLTYKGASKIMKLKTEIMINCKSPKMAINSTTTTQNPLIERRELQNKIYNLEKEFNEKSVEHDSKYNELNIELFQLKNELQINQLIIKKLKNELQKEQKEVVSLKNLRDDKQEENQIRIERTETVKLRAELSSTKDEQKKEQDETIKIINERDQIMILDFTTKLFSCEVNQQNLTENKCNSLIIHCEFLDTDGVYSCMTRDLIIYQKNMELITVFGTHLKSNSNGDVTELLIENSAMFYWSNDIHKLFPGLKTLEIQNAQLKQLTKGDFDSAFNLTVLVVNGNDIKSLGDEVFHGTEEHLTDIDLNSNQIEKLSSGTFHGLKQLKVLSLKDNLITKLQSRIFKDVVMLEILILTGNKIKFLHGKLLKYNTRLITFAVDHNKLREIGEDILSYSVMLKDVHLEENDCIDEGTNEQTTIYERTTNDLIFVIKNCCKNPAEALNVLNCGHKGWKYLSL